MLTTICTFTRDHRWQPALPGGMDSSRTLVLVFGAPEYASHPAPLRELRRAFPQSHLLGCSTAGEISGTTISDGTLSVAITRFSETELASAAAPVRSAEGSRAAGASIAEALNRPNLRSVFLLSDGLQVNGSELVRGMNEVLAAEVQVSGGLAADGDRFQSTWVLDSAGAPRSGRVTAIGFYGDAIRVGHGTRGGWDIFGPERRVTRAEGNTLFELDGRPALSLYKSYLGERATGLPATALLFPLALRPDSTTEQSIVRTVLSVDEERESMTFAGDIPEGSLAQLMRANFDRLIDGAAEAGAMAAASAAASTPVLSIAISCVGRRLVLGERTEEETEAIYECMPAGVHQVGFYSYGELSPSKNGRCDLHNQTMTLTTLSEDLVDAA